MSGRSLGNAAAPHSVVSFSTSNDGGLTWEKATPIATIGNGGCQSSVVGALDGSYAMIASPVYAYGQARYNVSMFVASVRMELSGASFLSTL